MVFGRVVTAMITPFDGQKNVDYGRAADLACELVRHGSDGILVSGTTGESPALSAQEKLGLIKAVHDAVGGQAMVLAGTGSYNTRESIELTVKAEDEGADGIMLVTPYYNKPPQSSLYEHFAAIARETNLPVMLYNVPGRTSRNLEPETVARLADIENIRAVKEASGDLKQIAEIVRITPDDFSVYSGDDAFTLPILSVGGKGIVSVASHLVGTRIRDMILAYEEGKVEQAAAINGELYPLFDILFITTNPIPVKTALNLCGYEAGPLRLPLTPMDEGDLEKLKDVLSEYELL